MIKFGANIGNTGGGKRRHGEMPLPVPSQIRRPSKWPRSQGNGRLGAFSGRDQEKSGVD